MRMPKLNTKAFTLVESLVAVVLIALVAISFLSALIMSVSYVRKAFELRTSSLILQEQMSLARELNYADIQSLGSSFSSGYMSSLKDAAGTIYKSYYAPGSKILKLTFKLDWTTAEKKSASRSVVTLITDQGIDKK